MGITDPLWDVLNDLDRLAHWVGREEPKRAELWSAVDEVKRCVQEGQDARRPLLRCAVAVNGLWSTALKRLLVARVRDLYAKIESTDAHHAA